MITGFAPILVLTPYGTLEEAAPPGHPVASPTRDAPSVFMQPLDRLMNTRSVAPRTWSHEEGPPSFRAPYPLTSPLTAPSGIIHSPNPQPIIGDDQMASVTRMLNPVEDEYLRTFHLTPQGTRNSLQPPALIAPQPRLTYVPPWPPAQLGPLPPMPSAQPAPMAPAPVPLVPVAPPQAFYPAPPVAPPQVVYPVPPGAPPAVPPHVIGQGYPPGWGAPMPPYGHAPVQPYLNAYPPAYWPPYLPHYAAPQGGFDEDSEMAKPDKFTG